MNYSAKLLVVHLSNPGETHYHNPDDIARYMEGRFLDETKLYAVVFKKQGEYFHSKEIIPASDSFVSAKEFTDEIKAQLIDWSITIEETK